MKQSKRLVVLTGASGILGSATLTFSPGGAECRLDLLKDTDGALIVQSRGKRWEYPITARKQRFSLADGCAEPITLRLERLPQPHPDGSKREEDVYAVKQEKDHGKSEDSAKQEIATAEATVEQAEPYDDEKTAEVDFYPSNLAVWTDEKGEMSIGTNIDDVLGQQSVLRATYGDRPLTLNLDGLPSRAKSVFAQERLDVTTRHGFVPPTESVGRKLTFAEKSRERIRSLLEGYEKEKDIEALMPDTRWVRVPFDEKGRYYLFGTVGDPVEYLCYGVPAKFSAHAPESLGPQARWIPRNPAHLQGDGYWLLFQDAKTGKSVPCDR